MTAMGRWQQCDHKSNTGGGGHGVDSTVLYQIRHYLHSVTAQA